MLNPNMNDVKEVELGYDVPKPLSLDNDIDAETHYSDVDAEMSSGNTIETESDICVICLEKLENGTPIYFHCKHSFHLDCILEWIHSLFKKHMSISCPTCRVVECYSHSPHYEVMKKIVGFVDTPNSYNVIGVSNDIYIRNREDEVIFIPNQQANLDRQAQQEIALNKAFLKFIILLFILMVVFILLLVLL